MDTSILKVLAMSVGLPLTATKRLVYSSPLRYKVFQIDKRNGGKRTIAQPSRVVKFMQRLLIPRLRTVLPVHDCAYAYTIGKGIKANACMHMNSSYLLKYDFESFFPSIKPEDLISRLQVVEELSDEDRKALGYLFFWKPKQSKELELSIGAPSSPLISNMVMYEFDTLVATECKNRNIIYTRYADDLCFSSDTANVLQDFSGLFYEIVKATSSPKLTINESKTINVSKKYRRSVTGLVITPVGSVSIGRDKKRMIHSMINSFKYSSLNDKDVNRLKGLLAFVNDVEHDFLVLLRKKYGATILGSLFPSVCSGDFS